MSHAHRDLIRRRTQSLAGALLVTGVFLTGCATEPAPAPQPSTVQPEPPLPQEHNALDRDAATESLFAAVEEDDLEAAAAAIAGGADLHFRGSEGRTPLVMATKNHHVDMAKLLLEAGSDPNVQDDMSDSAFLYAGAEGFDEILAATLEHGADVTSTNRYGGTALIPAAEHGYVTTVNTLITAGVPLDHVNHLGWTALHEAIVLGNGSHDHLLVVRQLLDAGASPTLPDGNGTSPRALAEAHGYREIAAEIERFL